jgi:hypothetical protein
MASAGDANAAKAHFAQALGSSAQRPFVRELEISAFLWRRTPELEDEVIRIVNESRVNGESLSTGSRDRLTSSLWSIYHSRLVWGNENGKEDFFRTLPPKDLLSTYLWLFRAYDNSSNREPYLFMLAQLRERTGDRPDALVSYQSLLELLTARGAGSGSMAQFARLAIRRLRSP